MSDFTIDQAVKIFPQLVSITDNILQVLDIESEYYSYLVRHQAYIWLFKEEETLRIPQNIDYSRISGLPVEVCEKLTYHKPLTAGIARRLSGITPAATTAIIMYLKTKYRE